MVEIKNASDTRSTSLEGEGFLNTGCTRDTSFGVWVSIVSKVSEVSKVSKVSEVSKVRRGLILGPLKLVKL